MKTPSTLIVGYGITGKNLHREIIFVPLTFINVKNLHVKNIMCNFVS